jgi:FkbM family methyltransferase
MDITTDINYYMARLPLLWSRIKPRFTVKLGEKTLRVPFATYLNKWKPSWKTELIGHFVKLNSGDFIDIGANVGQTLSDFYSLNHQGRYIGFEPNPDCVSALQEIIRQNGLEGYSIVPVGLSDKNTILSLYSGSTSLRDPGATTVADLRPAKRCDFQLVPVHRFDDIREALAIDKIAFMKIDVEGAERQVLEGMPEILAELKPPITCEVLRMDAHADKVNYQNNVGRLMSLLASSNYLVFRINKTTDASHVVSLTLLTEFPLDVWSTETTEANDYLFIPRDKEAQIPKAWLPPARNSG